MATTISTARQILSAHGFKLLGCGTTYRVTRDLPAYGQSRPADKGFHRDWRGFNASEVSLTWVRRLADALESADLGRVTSCCCAEAWDASRKASLAWEEAGLAHRDACTWRRPDFTLTQQMDFGVAELKAGGAARVAELVQQVLLESWQIWHPISRTVAAIDRGRQPLAV